MRIGAGIGIGFGGENPRAAYAVGGVLPSLVLDFERGFLTGPLSLDRASAGTYIDPSGVLRVANADVARYDYSTGRRALLIEPAATNLLTHAMSNLASGWSVSSATVQGLSLNALGLFAGVSVASQGAGWNRLLHTAQVSLTAGNAITISVWARLLTSPTLRIVLRNETAATESQVQLSGGTVTALTQVAGALSAMSATLQPDGLTWKIAVTLTPGANGSLTLGIGPGSAVAGQSIAALAAQIENGSSATSFIASSGAVTVRAADAASITVAPGTYDRRIVSASGTADTSGVVITAGAKPIGPRSLYQLLYYSGGTLP